MVITSPNKVTPIIFSNLGYCCCCLCPTLFIQACTRRPQHALGTSCCCKLWHCMLLLLLMMLTR